MAAPITEYNYGGFKTYVEFVRNSNHQQTQTKRVGLISTALFAVGVILCATLSLSTVVATVLIIATVLSPLVAIAALIAREYLKSRAANVKSDLFTKINHAQSSSKELRESGLADTDKLRKLLESGSDKDLKDELYNKCFFKSELILAKAQLILATLKDPTIITKTDKDGGYYALIVLINLCGGLRHGFETQEKQKFIQLFREAVVCGGTPNLSRLVVDKSTSYMCTLIYEAVELDLPDALDVLHELGAKPDPNIIVAEEPYNLSRDKPAFIQYLRHHNIVLKKT